MYGNILNNKQVKRLVVDDNQLTIRPWDESRLKLAHYALRPGGILEVGPLDSKGRRKTTPLHNFAGGEEYKFAPRQYSIVEVEELIILPEGLVGHFIPSSTLIDQGFSITAGKIDANYGQLLGKTQKVRFGIKNLKDEENILPANENIAHVYFIDLRGLGSDVFGLTDREIQAFKDRFPRFLRAHDDGPAYE